MKNKLNDKKIEFKVSQYTSKEDSFKIMGHWTNQARKEGWSENEIFTVLDDASMLNRKDLISLLQLYSQ